MKKSIRVIFIFIQFILLSSSQISFAQFVDFQSSNLPIIVIDTNGKQILNEPKIKAHMGIIYNGEGARNFLTDTFNEYDGYIGIELRGKSSQNWDKKPYAVETRDSFGENNNVSIFGMPKENDWVLHAPFVDKSLIRNVFMYKLAAEMGWYAPRTQFCELILNGEYMGVYVFIEKIKRDKGRVNISKPESTNISGGYLLEMIINSLLEDDETHFKLEQSDKEIVVKYPKPEDITEEELNYIAEYFNEFESILNSDSFDDTINGYSKFIDLPSFIDHMLLSEAFNQLDAFSHSVYFYKDQNEKIKLGPGWDYNRCMGNAKYYTSWSPNVWWLREPYGNDPALWYRINWPKRLMADPNFMSAYATRWYELRTTIFSFDHINSIIDSCVTLLDEAKVRNFDRWDVLGVDYNNKYIFETHEEEINYIKNWINQKFTWLDDQLSTSENYALNNLYDYSGQQENPYNPAANAVDGDELTRWSVETFPQWIEIDLGGLKEINQTVVFPHQLRPYQYIIEAKSNIDETYSTIVDRTNNLDGDVQISDSFTPIKTRFLKLTVTGSEYYSGTWCSIIEFKAFGNLVTDIDSGTNRRELNTFHLANAYPNPFNSSTIISFEIAETSDLKIDIFNSLGQKIKTIENGMCHVGLNNIEFNASELPSGTYFYRVYAGKNNATGKVLLLK
jgi:spore coat protein CotH